MCKKMKMVFFVYHVSKATLVAYSLDRHFFFQVRKRIAHAREKVEGREQVHNALQMPDCVGEYSGMSLLHIEITLFYWSALNQKVNLVNQLVCKNK